MTTREDSILNKLQNCIQSLGHTPKTSPLPPTTEAPLTTTIPHRTVSNLRKENPPGPTATHSRSALRVYENFGGAHRRHGLVEEQARATRVSREALRKLDTKYDVNQIQRTAQKTPTAFSAAKPQGTTFKLEIEQRKTLCQDETKYRKLYKQPLSARKDYSHPLRGYEQKKESIRQPEAAKWSSCQTSPLGNFGNVDNLREQRAFERLRELNTMNDKINDRIKGIISSFQRKLR